MIIFIGIEFVVAHILKKVYRIFRKEDQIACGNTNSHEEKLLHDNHEIKREKTIEKEKLVRVLMLKEFKSNLIKVNENSPKHILTDQDVDELNQFRFKGNMAVDSKSNGCSESVRSSDGEITIPALNLLSPGFEAKKQFRKSHFKKNYEDRLKKIEQHTDYIKKKLIV